jgi:hypothetical protein
MLALRASPVSSTLGVRRLQYCFALMFLLAAVFAGGPLGCDLIKPPGLPQPQVEAPQGPDVQAPDAPKPGMPEDDDGMCCMRGMAPVEKVCGGADRCCTAKYDRSACEDAKGVWFYSARGCQGAC